MKLMRIFVFISILFCITNTFAQNVTVIGIGRLGISFALCLERAGYNVLGVDISPEYVSLINSKTFQSSEPHITEYLSQSENFKATISLEEGLNFSDICFIAVSTTRGTDAYNFTDLTKLLTDVSALDVSNKHIVITSTLFPGYIKDTALPLLKDCKNITVSYNPEFIAQGEIVRGTLEPDMVLIGEGSPEIGQRLEEIYHSLCTNEPYIARMSVASAEITKLSSNCFITMKIAYANLIGDIADETSGADKIAILNAAGKDKRIGSKYLRPGYGFGGPCFPRDNRGLGRYAIQKGIEPLLFNATDQTNALHTEYMAKKLLGEDREEYIFRDVSYKPNSQVKILEESQKLLVAKKVAEGGKKVTIIDCDEVIGQLKKTFGSLFNYVIQ